MKVQAKRKIQIIVGCIFLALVCALAVGCAGSSDGSKDVGLGTETTPKTMPAQHQKYVDRPEYKCYKCHGASEVGNPTAKNAVAMPTGHYADNDPATMEIDPIRYECLNCHSVDSDKQMDPAVLEEAEIETGQQDLDEK